MTTFASFGRITRSSKPAFEIHAEFEDYLRNLSVLEKSQHPFAVAKTLTEVAKGGQAVAQARTRKAYRLHTDWIPQSIRITPASKLAFAQAHKTEAIVRTDPRIGFMVAHETGDDKVPAKTALTIPQANLLSAPGVKTGTGKIAAKYQPRRILRKNKTIPAFIRNGLVLVRTGPGRYPLVALYRLSPRAHIKPDWHFGESVIAYAQHHIPIAYERNLKAAVATAFVR